jgi:hypothetical protein
MKGVNDTAPKRRWLLNAATLLVMGPLVAMGFLGVMWIVGIDPVDLGSHLRAFAFLGLVVGVFVCGCYLAACLLGEPKS